MAVVDSYSETNESSNTSSNVGQSFTGDGSILDKAQFYLKKLGSPTGNIVARIYAHSGTYGTSSVPTGAALAVSDNFDCSTLTTSYALIDFTFSGANRITLTAGTKYVVTLEHGKTGPNSVLTGQDTTSATHAGNKSFFSGSWSATSDDLCFYIYGVAGSPSPSLTPSSSVSLSPSISVSSSPSPSPAPSDDMVVLVAKSGYDALRDNDPRHFRFDSRLGTLKYYDKVQSIVTFTASGTVLSGRNIITHNLGYYPFVEVFVRVYIGSPSGDYEPVPFYGAGATVLYNASYIIKDNTIELYGDINGVSASTWNFDFLVFIYKNDLSL